jgi:uridine kinase
MHRSELVDYLADRITQSHRPHPVRVAIDGPDAAGKTTLADELATSLQARGSSVMRASIDGFHNRSDLRHHHGNLSPEGYYLDSFDYERLISSLLSPLGPDGSLEYRRAVFDYQTDSELDGPVVIAEPNAVLLFDGVFLLRRELVSFWDFSIGFAQFNS